MDPESPEDPWLTIAEIAEELRCSPATIRSWISQGALRAMRPGKRKLLVRRSELAQMLAGEGVGEFDDLGWRSIETIESPQRSPHHTEYMREHTSRRGWLGVAETEWRKALGATAMAPPDEGFHQRVATIAEAAARKAAALADLGDEEPAQWWQRQSALPLGVLSYELRPGGNRPGPAALWAKVDQIVASLGDAMQSHSLPAEQQALEELSLTLHEIVERLIERDVYPWPTDWDDGSDDVESEDRDDGDAAP
jgi:excisionase family DNA binding protein